MWAEPDYLNVQGLGTFDLAELSWQTGYNAGMPAYQRSQSVQTAYSTRYVEGFYETKEVSLS